MSQDNKPNLAGWAALITAIAALITAIGFTDLIPVLVKRFLPSEEPVAPKLEKQSVTPKLEENPVSSPEVSLNPGDTLKPLEDLVIIVKDSETKQTLGNAEIEITYEKGIISGRTLDDGTDRLQIPPQDLGTVTILVKKEGYQQKEIPKDFSVNPNEPLTIYLEQLDPYTVPQESYYNVPPESYKGMTHNNLESKEDGHWEGSLIFVE
jgi:hypothetical protein